MVRITAVYGSPRRRGNTATLLKHAVVGARSAGARVKEISLRDKKITPCLEIYGCKDSGQCVIRDDFGGVRDTLLASDGIMIASPIFFYAVSAHTKILMDRCQSLWVKKNWVEPDGEPLPDVRKKTLFISVGATTGKQLFKGPLLTMRYFLDVLDADLWESLLVRGVDLEGEIYHHPEHLETAYRLGRELADAIRKA
jgi:multimeric flavodoxin WrbA